MSVTDPLHYGTIGGLWTKAIWFLFGLLVSGMAITGFMIWGSRTLRNARQPLNVTPEAESTVGIQQPTLTSAQSEETRLGVKG